LRDTGTPEDYPRYLLFYRHRNHAGGEPLRSHNREPVQGLQNTTIPERNPSDRPRGKGETIPPVQEVHVQTQLDGGVTELFAMVVTGQRHAAAMLISGLPGFPEKGVSGLVQHGDQKVVRAFEHTGMNGHFME
jgi:hypothetical protein